MHEAYLDEMATDLGVNPATLQYWANRRLVPSVKDARGRYLFDKDEVLKVVAEWPPTPPTNIRRRPKKQGGRRCD